MNVDVAMAVSPHDTRWHGARTAMFREHARSLWAKAMGAAGALDARLDGKSSAAKSEPLQGCPLPYKPTLPIGAAPSRDLLWSARCVRGFANRRNSYRMQARSPTASKDAHG